MPWLTDGEISIFESGAILLHLGESSDVLMPTDPAQALRGFGMPVRGAQFRRGGKPALVDTDIPRDKGDTPAWRHLDGFLNARLDTWNRSWQGREWLAGTFSVADIFMADVRRLVDRFAGLAGHPACRDYIARATARPSFVKAHADQMAHFAAAD
jgi:glutathione S-transferase